MDALLGDAAVIVSVALQCGIPARALAKSIARLSTAIDAPATEPASPIGAALDLLVRIRNALTEATMNRVYKDRNAVLRRLLLFGSSSGRRGEFISGASCIGCGDWGKLAPGTSCMGCFSFRSLSRFCASSAMRSSSARAT